MAEHEAQTGSDGSALSDETLRLYLLCRLKDDQRLELDERLLVDNQLAERIVLVESELTDDFVAGRLDTVEREAFTKRFLVTEERKRQLYFTSALQDYSRSRTAAPAAVITPQPGPAWRESIAGLFSLNRPAWAFAGSVAVLLLLIGLAWFVVKQSRDTQGLIARHAPVPSLSPQASPQVAASPANSSVPQPETGQQTPVTPTPSEPAVRPTIASLVLLAGASRGGGDLPRIALPDGERDIVRLSLVLEAVADGTYQASLLTAEGQTVTARSKLKADIRNERVVLDIPARLLRNGDYQIKLSHQRADGQLETVGRYYFRALD